MKALRNHDYPPKVTGFTSLDDSVKSALDCRIALLAGMNGYPAPAHVLARVYQYFKLDNMNTLKHGLLKLRDIAKYASEILATVPQLRIDKFQLSRTEVFTYIGENKKGYGFESLNTQDLDLVAYLITSAEMPEASWALDCHTDPETNTITKLNKLYETLRDNRVETAKLPLSKAGTTVKGKDVTVEYVDGKDKPVLYDADVNAIKALHEFTTIRQFLGEKGGWLQLERPQDTVVDLLQREDNILRIADIRLIDHLLCLFTNPETWNYFIPPRTQQGPGANEERAKSLKLMAGYFHSLLLLPQFYRLELFKQGFTRIEAWLGMNFVIPEDIQKNYDVIVRKFDVFNIAAEAHNIYELHQVPADSNLNTSIYKFFSEFSHIYGFDKEIKAAETLAATTPKIRLTDFKQLKSQNLNYILLSHPVGKFELTKDFMTRILDKEIMRHTLNDALHSIQAMTDRYLNEDVVQKLVDMNLKVPFPLHQTMPSSHEYTYANHPKVEGGKFFNRYHSFNYDYETEYKFRRDPDDTGGYDITEDDGGYLYTMCTARDLVTTKPSKYYFDREMAKKFRGLLARDWKSLYPSNVVMGDRSIDPSSVAVSEIEMRQLFEYIAGDNFGMIERTFATPYSREIWATLLSSFALLYVDDRILKDISVKVEKTSASYLTLVEGSGMPYGVTYTELEKMQKIGKKAMEDKTVMIRITNGVYFMFLKSIPVPTWELGIDTFTNSRQYYYCGGNGEHIDVKRFCFDDGLLQFHMRPLMQALTAPHVLFDKLYGYVNNTLLMQGNLAIRLAPNTEDRYSWPIALAKTDWKGDKFNAMLDFIKVTSYAAGSGAAIAASPAAKETTLGNMMDEFKKSVEEVEKTNTVATAQETKSTIEPQLEKFKSPKSEGGNNKKHNNNPKVAKPANDSKASDEKKKKEEEEAAAAEE